MSGFADTGFLASLYLVEQTSATARQTIAALREPLPLIPLLRLELRNSFNLAIVRQRITEAERDAFWQRFQAHIGANVFVERAIPAAELHDQARQTERPSHAEARHPHPRSPACRGGPAPRRAGILQFWMSGNARLRQWKGSA